MELKFRVIVINEYGATSYKLIAEFDGEEREILVASSMEKLRGQFLSRLDFLMNEDIKVNYYDED